MPCKPAEAQGMCPRRTDRTGSAPAHTDAHRKGGGEKKEHIQSGYVLPVLLFLLRINEAYTDNIRIDRTGSVPDKSAEYAEPAAQSENPETAVQMN